MKRKAFIAAALLAGWITSPLSAAPFASVTKFVTRASVTVSTGAPLTIVAEPLAPQAFFGKNAIIPIKVVKPDISPAGLQVRIVYSLVDKNGIPTGLGTVSVPIALTRDPVRTDTLVGDAVIPRSDLVPIQNGGRLDYMFQAIQNGAGSVLGFNGPAAGPGTILTVLPDPYQTTITDRFCAAVGPSGARVSAPDLYMNDGRTSVTLAPGAIGASDTLCIQVKDPASWPLGPGGARPVSVYSFSLENTTLGSPAELVLSYPVDSSGKVLDSGADARNLGMYWLDDTNKASLGGQWRPLSRAVLDSTLHTMTGMTSHFSTFGLFAAGAVGAPGLRPSERIITPNGDGINDTVAFLGITAQDEVQIFDVRGRRIRSLTGVSPTWDGRDDDGSIVESGVYVYQYTSQGERVSGVVGVAK